MSSALEKKFARLWQSIDGPQPTEEHQFHATRRWRFDFAWPDAMVAVEIEGGTYAKSRHTTGAGFKKDCEKYNAAIFDGWFVLRLDSTMVTGAHLQRIRDFIADRLRPCADGMEDAFSAPTWMDAPENKSNKMPPPT